MRPAAIVFDLYGTLLRIDSLAAAAQAAGASDPQRFVEAWRQKQIEYTWCATLMDDYRDFDTLTARALDYTCGAFALTLDAGVRRQLAKAWLTVQPYDDVAPALKALRKRNVPLCVLTNGVRASAEQALHAGGIRDLLDDLLSVETVRAYKPDPRVYRLATARFGCDPERILFVSSNGWDASGAGAFGFAVAWCNRASRPAETFGYPPLKTLRELGELMTLLT
ncbi:MAG: haloacid dehalogenase type II [Candidatus Velthaea sp.]|jgi:2-haloacid dehalogenase